MAENYDVESQLESFRPILDELISQFTEYLSEMMIEGTTTEENEPITKLQRYIIDQDYSEETTQKCLSFCEGMKIALSTIVTLQRIRDIDIYFIGEDENENSPDGNNHN